MFGKSSAISMILWFSVAPFLEQIERNNVSYSKVSLRPHREIRLPFGFFISQLVSRTYKKSIGKDFQMIRSRSIHKDIYTIEALGGDSSNFFWSRLLSHRILHLQGVTEPRFGAVLSSLREKKRTKVYKCVKTTRLHCFLASYYF